MQLRVTLTPLFVHFLFCKQQFVDLLCTISMLLPAIGKLTDFFCSNEASEVYFHWPQKSLCC